MIGLAALASVLRGLEPQRFLSVVVEADVRYLTLVPVAIGAGELMRAWKWRQLLHALRAVATLRLFGAIMAGYLADLIVPVGLGPLVRAWLVARVTGLKATAVLATVAVDRVIDGVVFVGFIIVALAFVEFTDPTGDIRLGFIWGGAGSLVVFPLLLLFLAHYKRQAMRTESWLHGMLGRMPRRLAAPAWRLSRSFAEGIVWPRETWRRVGIVLASAVIRLISATHFLWAGLALGVVLRPAEYIFLLVFLGFLVVLTRFLHLAGGFVVSAVFALGLLGVGKEQALAMTLIVLGGNLLSVVLVGAAVLWREGVTLADLRVRGTGDGEDA